MTADQFIAKRVYWPKIAMFLFAIVLPQIAIAWSNREVFPDALWIATVFVVVVIGISAISTYFSGNASPSTRQYALWHDFAIAALTCVVALFHFQVAREVSAGKEARVVQERQVRNGQENADRDVQRQLALRQADADRIRAETEAAKEQRRLLIQLPPSQRRLGPSFSSAQPSTSPIPFSSTVIAKPQDEEPSTIKSPEEVRSSWFGWLFWASAFEIIIAVLGGMILMMVWQWDVDGDGIADHLQNRQPAIGFNTASSPSYASKTGAAPAHRDNFYDPNRPK